MTKRLAVIGHPLAHTLSPAIHSAATKALGLDLQYEAVETPPDRLADFVAELREDGWLGCNVTVPHKQAIMPLLDKLLPDARDIGAVNTISKSGQELVGGNTDAVGFLEDLQASLGPVEGKTVSVLGAGGAAHAVCWILRDRAKRVLILNRSRDRAEALADRFEMDVGSAQDLEHCDLIVNCTSAGLHGDESPISDDWLSQGVKLYDLIYNPPETHLMRVVRERGGTATNGLGMLVRQAAASFEIWTGIKPPLDVMFQAANDELGIRNSELETGAQRRA